MPKQPKVRTPKTKTGGNKGRATILPVKPRKAR